MCVAPNQIFTQHKTFFCHGDELTLNDVNGDRVRLGLCGGAGVIAGVGLGDLGHEESGGPPPALGHHADPAPDRQKTKLDIESKWDETVQTCAEKRDCFAKHQPGVAGCGWRQPGRNFLST